ncbi:MULTISPECIES: DUF1186 domain-containing protein [Cysteiniphilum]|uniref:SEC-C motif-containing protein n=1 Tax=Cysteiniphilum litorale TaxID=2056700 RepID=A0A8J3E923_9GAMM|nr:MULTISPECIES: DUF1186 domain-containing protein [Cysteiniphilum]GGF98120.1 hypothetical protein GCM10010995_14160 [Cysteiniphilum litorale]
MSDAVEIRYNFEIQDEWYSSQTIKDIDSWSDYYLDEFLVKKPDELSELDNDDIRILVRDSFWWMYRLYLNKPNFWDEKKLKYFLCSHVPRYWIVENDLKLECLTNVLVVFIKWLDAQRVTTNQDNILRVIIDSQDEFQKNLNNKKLWSDRKTLKNGLRLPNLLGSASRGKYKANRPADEEEISEIMSSFIKKSGIDVEKNKLESKKIRSKKLRAATADDLNNYPNAATVYKKLNEIGYTYFPETELAAAIHYKDDISPMLLGCLDDLIANKGIDKYDTTLFMYAFYLLSIFRDQRAYPKIIKIMQLDRDNELLGDLITSYDLKNIIASTYNGDLSILDKLIKDSDAYFYARSAAIHSIVTLKVMGKIEQSTFENKLDYYLNYKYSNIAKEQKEMVTSVGSCILESDSLHLLNKLQELIIQNKIDIDHYGLESIRSSVDKIKNKADDCRTSPYHFIDDIKSTFGTWAMFHESSVSNHSNDQLLFSNKERSKKKAGRNDPCPCGSGKKYKKCCLLNS